MAEDLDLLLDDGIIDEVLGRLQSGKEADVYRVRRQDELLAAKVYKERQHRSFKNNAAYMEGRRVRSSRTQRAVDKKSRFGMEAAEDAWKAEEARALSLLHARGVRVPVPVMFYEGVLLMQLLTDEHGGPAPRLIDARIDPGRAEELYLDLRGQIIRMLNAEIIHGDLSPYNVLLAAGGPTIIDFPQVVSAAHNRQSEFFFTRDFENIVRFLGRLDRRLMGRLSEGREIWRAYLRRELSAEFVPQSGNAHAAAHAAQVVHAPQAGPTAHAAGAAAGAPALAADRAERGPGNERPPRREQAPRDGRGERRDQGPRGERRDQGPRGGRPADGGRSATAGGPPGNSRPAGGQGRPGGPPPGRGRDGRRPSGGFPAGGQRPPAEARGPSGPDGGGPRERPPGEANGGGSSGGRQRPRTPEVFVKRAGVLRPVRR
jgi:RIO kinase 1